MPATSAHLQKHFKLTIEEGLPQAAIDVIGAEQWLMCCPLCGCIHQLVGVNDKVPYAPLCQTVPSLFKVQQAAWHKLYPDIIPYKTLQLVKATRR